MMEPAPAVVTAAAVANTTTTTTPNTPTASATAAMELERKKKKKKKRPAHKSKMVTGYIIYASEIRKEVIKKYPDRDFGDISKLVGIEWKNLPTETKAAYEKRAQEQNAKSKAIAAEEKAKEEELAAVIKAQEEQQQQMQQQQQLPISNGNGHTYSSSILGLPHNISNGIVAHPQDGSNGPTTSMQLQLGHLYQQPGVQVAYATVKLNSQQQPLHIIQQQHQPVATTVQYCNNTTSTSTTTNHCESSSSPQLPYQIHDSTSQPSSSSSCSSAIASPALILATTTTPGVQLHSNNLQSNSNKQLPLRNTIVYRKPTTVRLKPKDTSTQTDPTRWINNGPKKPLRYSQKFIDYLSKSFNA